MLTPQFQIKLKDELSEKPLEEGEFRRIEGMGKLYVSLTENPPSDSTYYLKYTLKIEGKDHYFFGEDEA